MNKSLKKVCSALLLTVAFAAIAFGQRTTGDIEGTITDEKGAVVPGASVTVTGVSVGFNRTVQSDEQGVYRFPQIPAGTYKLTTAAINGFAQSVLENVTVTIEKTTTVNVTVGATAAVNTVDISADPLGVNLDTTDSKVQTNITEKLIDEIPKGASFTSLLKVSPGTRSEPLSGGFQVDGASGSENSFVIDGLALENFRTGTLNTSNNIPTSLVSEIQVKTSGFEAEHGGASGGVVTLATKSGTNSWRGEFGTVFETAKLQPAPRFAVTRFTAGSASAAQIASNPDFVYAIPLPRDNYVNFFPTASLGGAIIKNRAWFYGNYSPQIFETLRNVNFINTPTNANFSTGRFIASPRAGQAPIEYRVKQRNEYAFGRLDASIFDNLRVTGTYLWNPVITDGNIPYAAITTSIPTDTTLAGVTYNSQNYSALQGGRTSSNNITTQVNYTPLNNLVATFRYGRAFLNEKGGNYAIPSQVRYRCQGSQTAYTTVATGCLQNFQNVLTNSLTTRDVSLRNEYNGDVTYLLSKFLGTHEFKGGYQYGTTSNDLLSGNASTGIVSLYYGQDFTQIGTLVGAESGGASLNNTCALGTASCLGVGTLYRFGSRGVASNKYQAIYLQDKWQPLKNLTLNLGVRTEKEDLPSFNGDSGTRPLSFNFNDKIAPRLGGAYDIFGDGKNKIFASYGWFYDRLKFELPRGSFGGSFYRIDWFRITAAHPNYDYYTPSVILGSFTDPIGGGNPSTTGGISQLQSDFRIPSNLTTAQKQALGLCVACGVVDDLKAFRQSEVTVGYERELSRLFVLSARYTRKNVDHAIEDHAIIGINQGENYYIGNPGEGSVLAADRAAGYAKSTKPQRLYNGLEIALNKRLSSNYFFNVNYTLSRLYGNYSGLASSDEAAGGNGRTAPGVNRFFDYIINGFTATGEPDNGNLATDRRHALKAFGGYNFDWFGSRRNTTEFSFFQQVLQGTPQTTFITVIATAIPLSKRGDLGRTPNFYQTDLALSHKYRFGRDDKFTIAFDVDVINALNNNSVLQLNTTKYRTTNTIAATDIDPTFVATTTAPTALLNRVLNGQIGPQIAGLASGANPSISGTTSTAGRTNPVSSTYGQPSLYQSPRLVRFGFRLFF